MNRHSAFVQVRGCAENGRQDSAGEMHRHSAFALVRVYVENGRQDSAWASRWRVRVYHPLPATGCGRSFAATLKPMLRLLGLAILTCASLRAETVVVLRFFNHANSAGLDWIAESIAETVQDALYSVGLLVLGREARTGTKTSWRPWWSLPPAAHQKGAIGFAEALFAGSVVAAIRAARMHRITKFTSV